MARNQNIDAPEDFQSDMNILMFIFAGLVWRNATADEAIMHMAKHGAAIAPTVAAQIDRSAGVDSFFRILGRSMWNATPQPALDYRIKKLAEPGRNDPCFCGSLRKYKQCCASAMELPISPALMLNQLLMVMPRKYWADLVHSHINLDWIFHVAWQWREKGEYENIVHLLEPWFKHEKSIPNQHAELLNILLDAYLEENKPRKRKSLAQAAISRGEREVQYVGWQRMALIEMDAGNLTASRHAINEAMRASPDNPDLALLEIQCLIAEGKDAIARERANFWHLKLQKLRNPDLQDRMDWLLAIANDPQQAMLNATSLADASIGRLQAQIQTLSKSLDKPQCYYRLVPFEGSTGPLTPIEELRKALLKWNKVFPVNKPPSTHVSLANNQAAWDNPNAWLTVLEKQPVLWHSFDVIDDIVGALDSYDVFGATEPLTPLLLKHAEALFNKAMDAHQASALKCEWGFLENRPALRLLARKALDDKNSRNAVDREAAFNLMLRMVETINPNDNHGLRDLVLAGLIARNKAEDAIALAAQYPEDMAGVEFNRVLAFYAAGRMDEANEAAKYACTRYPHIYKMLVAKSPRQPKLNDYGYAVGSPQEAWLYRENFLAVWQSQSGALHWLKTTVK